MEQELSNLSKTLIAFLVLTLLGSLVLALLVVKENNVLAVYDVDSGVLGSVSKSEIKKSTEQTTLDLAVSNNITDSISITEITTGTDFVVYQSTGMSVVGKVVVPTITTKRAEEESINVTFLINDVEMTKTYKVTYKGLQGHVLKVNQSYIQLLSYSITDHKMKFRVSR